MMRSKEDGDGDGNGEMVGYYVWVPIAGGLSNVVYSVRVSAFGWRGNDEVLQRISASWFLGVCLLSITCLEKASAKRHVTEPVTADD